MLEALKKLFSSGSDVSCMRVMACVSLLAGILVAFVGLYKGSDLLGLSTLTGVFVGSAFGGKIMQKIQELKDAA